jgi:hypothetical protein
MGIIITVKEFYGKMWDKCASSVLSIECRTHLSHFKFGANMNVYEHISNSGYPCCPFKGSQDSDGKYPYVRSETKCANIVSGQCLFVRSHKPFHFTKLLWSFHS